MKKLFVLLLFCFSGCSIPHYADYQPELSSQPKDRVKYEADRKFCLDDAMRRWKKADPLVSKDAWMAPRHIAEECLAAKGYAVVTN